MDVYRIAHPSYTSILFYIHIQCVTVPLPLRDRREEGRAPNVSHYFPETDGAVTSSCLPRSRGRASCFCKGDREGEGPSIRREDAKSRRSSFVSTGGSTVRVPTTRFCIYNLVSKKDERGEEANQTGVSQWGPNARVTGETILRIFTRTTNAIA